jgi:hypothetical protein
MFFSPVRELWFRSWYVGVCDKYEKMSLYCALWALQFYSSLLLCSWVHMTPQVLSSTSQQSIWLASGLVFFLSRLYSFWTEDRRHNFWWSVLLVIDM